MEIMFAMHESKVNVKLVNQYDDHGYTRYEIGNQEGNPIYYGGVSQSHKLYVGYWDKDDDNMSAYPNQSFMVFYTEENGCILMIPVNNEEDIPRLLAMNVQIEDQMGSLYFSE